MKRSESHDECEGTLVVCDSCYVGIDNCQCHDTQSPEFLATQLACWFEVRGLSNWWYWKERAITAERP